ncbi:MAG TPA: cysteine desulfurase-like protein [Actinobacteria bacterium]|nr:putative cysteine desulfurase [bacterium BMS3Bbin01]HDH26556.1 cysteine desulfurase-like protein [Actinomycetota bacterium]
MLATVRSRFPALSRTLDGRQVAWLDGPGGTQTPRSVIDAMSGTLATGVSNLSPHFAPGRDAIAITDTARSAMADLLGAEHPSEVVFGQNMTSLTFSASRAIARTWHKGDEVIVTTLDHDANVTPWMLAARDTGAVVRRWGVHDDGTLDLDDLDRSLSKRTRLVAVTAASNALGTKVDVKEVTRRAHAAGALVYVDAVHSTPHRLLDVAGIGCDFLVCSAYKFFGPHTGILYGRAALLEQIDAYKVRPAPEEPPEKWETGTQSFESLAGVTAAVEYLASLAPLGTDHPRRSRLVAAYDWIGQHESDMARAFLEGIDATDAIHLWGIDRIEDRVPTFAVTVDGVHPHEAATRLAEEGIFVWSGHYYALDIMDRLGLLGSGGAIRVGFVHYNTLEEVRRVLEALAALTR